MVNDSRGRFARVLRAWPVWSPAAIGIGSFLLLLAVPRWFRPYATFSIVVAMASAFLFAWVRYRQEASGTTIVQIIRPSDRKEPPDDVPV